jgi:ABC-type Co2+ transport system permease subunit
MKPTESRHARASAVLMARRGPVTSYSFISMISQLRRRLSVFCGFIVALNVLV